MTTRDVMWHAARSALSACESANDFDLDLVMAQCELVVEVGMTEVAAKAVTRRIAATYIADHFEE